jgi:hypothetical protein
MNGQLRLDFGVEGKRRVNLPHVDLADSMTLNGHAWGLTTCSMSIFRYRCTRCGKECWDPRALSYFPESDCTGGR